MKLAATVDFEMFLPDLVAAPGPRDLAKGGRPPFDPELEFRVLVLQAMQGLSREPTEYLVRDRLSGTQLEMTAASRDTQHSPT